MTRIVQIGPIRESLFDLFLALFLKHLHSMVLRYFIKIIQTKIIAKDERFLDIAYIPFIGPGVNVTLVAFVTTLCYYFISSLAFHALIQYWGWMHDLLKSIN